MTATAGYSLENAARFGWNSLDGDLLPERRELARVTRKRIVVTVPQEDRWMAPYRLVFATYRDPTHLRYYTPDRLRELCASISPAKAEVFGEQLVPVAHLARTMLQPAGRS